MLRAGYNIKISAGAITAGGCLGILIPPSVLLIVYGATAGVSVVQLYAGAFFPGFMLAGLYLMYVIILAKLKPSLMPPLPESERAVPLPALAQSLASHGRNAMTGLTRALGGAAGAGRGTVVSQFIISLLPALVIVALLAFMLQMATAPVIEASTAGLVEAGGAIAADVKEESTGLIGQPAESGTGLAEPAEEAKEGAQPPGAEAPKLVHWLCEDLLLFRDEFGRLGLTEPSCPHRGR
jgi:TRAP-type mannitol/chloroaromatic compound transport system permease large subunit